MGALVDPCAGLLPTVSDNSVVGHDSTGVGLTVAILHTCCTTCHQLAVSLRAQHVQPTCFNLCCGCHPVLASFEFSRPRSQSVTSLTALQVEHAQRQTRTSGASPSTRRVPWATPTCSRRCRAMRGSSWRARGCCSPSTQPECQASPRTCSSADRGILALSAPPAMVATLQSHRQRGVSSLQQRGWRAAVVV